jgi:hypothetical protein
MSIPKFLVIVIALLILPGAVQGQQVDGGPNLIGLVDGEVGHYYNTGDVLTIEYDVSLDNNSGEATAFKVELWIYAEGGFMAAHTSRDEMLGANERVLWSDPPLETTVPNMLPPDYYTGIVQVLYFNTTTGDWEALAGDAYIFYY